MKTKCCKAPNLKLTKKLALILSAVMAAILAAGIILCAVLGFNSSVKNTKNVYVDVEYYTYKVNEDKIKDICNKSFAAKGLDVEDVQIGEKGVAGYDIVYVFDNDTSVKTLREVKVIIDQKLTEAGFVDKMITVTTQKANVFGTTANGYVARGMIALCVFAIASVLYVWLRYKLFAALYMLGGNLLTMGLTTALIALTRIPVTPSVAAAIAASVLFSTVTVLMFFNKLRAAQQEESAAEKSAEEIVSSSIAWKETTTFTALMAAALLIMICVGKAAIAWFSLSAIIGVGLAAFIGLVYVPVTFVPAKKFADKLAANKSSGYKGAKKGEKAKKSDSEEIVD